MPTGHRVTSKQSRPAPPLPKEAVPVGPRLLYVPRTGREYDVIWNGQKGDFSLVSPLEQPR